MMTPARVPPAPRASAASGSNGDVAIHGSVPRPRSGWRLKPWTGKPCLAKARPVARPPRRHRPRSGPCRDRAGGGRLATALRRADRLPGVRGAERALTAVARPAGPGNRRGIATGRSGRSVRPRRRPDRGAGRGRAGRRGRSADSGDRCRMLGTGAARRSGHPRPCALLLQSVDVRPSTPRTTRRGNSSVDDAVRPPSPAGRSS